jgi:hypothetical protein
MVQQDNGTVHLYDGIASGLEVSEELNGYTHDGGVSRRISSKVLSIRYEDVYGSRGSVPLKEFHARPRTDEDLHRDAETGVDIAAAVQAGLSMKDVDILFRRVDNAEEG